MASAITRTTTTNPLTTEQIEAAVRAVHRRATGPQDERELLDALGLNTPNGDR